MEKKRVFVLFGGRSGEHEVSLRSATSVMKALDREKYEVIPVNISSEGKWIRGLTPDQIIENRDNNQLFIDGGGNLGVQEIFLPADPGFGKMAVLEAGTAHECGGQIDVVIPVLHGTYGEDGTIQGLLELANVPYVGAGVLGSALGMDKVMMKTVLASHGLPQPGFLTCLRKDLENNPDGVVAAVEEGVGYPCFVKPANLGSSVGISKAHSREELIEGLKTAAAYDRKIIVEEFVDAREFEVSVLGNDDPAASLPGEVMPLKEFYDYEAKYVEGMSEFKIPAELPPDTVACLQKLAVKVFKALDCAGMARVDFFLRKSDGLVMVNEINTIPGFTNTSMYPKLWEASGISYSTLIDRLIDLAVERHSEKNKNKTTFSHSQG